MKNLADKKLSRTSVYNFFDSFILNIESCHEPTVRYPLIATVEPRLSH